MIKLEEQKGEANRPLCPHCSAELRSVYMREIQSILGRRYLYYCPACLKTLGVTHRKGFLMG